MDIARIKPHLSKAAWKLVEEIAAKTGKPREDILQILLENFKREKRDRAKKARFPKLGK